MTKFVIYSVFDKLVGLQQNAAFENKRLGSVLANIQQQYEEFIKITGHHKGCGSECKF
jgi:hypothetical protein